MAESTLLSASELQVVELRNAEAPGPVVLVCEHASDAIPANLKDLGLSPDARHSHIAWDPGALEIADRLALALDAPLVAARVSRLVYDCNRPPEAADAIPARSEVHAVPGNEALTPEARAQRIAEVYEPFHACLGRILEGRARQTTPPVLVTIHSFTPVFGGVLRSVEIGILHDSDSRLADAVIAQAEAGALAALNVQRNAPYGPDDGVTHTLRRHGLPQGYLNVMIEIRSDLIEDDAGRQTVADSLADALRAALETLRETSAMKEG